MKIQVYQLDLYSPEAGGRQGVRKSCGDDPQGRQRAIEWRILPTDIPLFRGGSNTVRCPLPFILWLEIKEEKFLLIIQFLQEKSRTNVLTTGTVEETKELLPGCQMLHCKGGDGWEYTFYCYL